MAWNDERGWSIEEMQWRDIHNSRVCSFEVWYRHCCATRIKSPDGRVVEYDATNPLHVEAVASEMVDVTWAVISKVRLAWFMGPHCLSDIPEPGTSTTNFQAVLGQARGPDLCAVWTDSRHGLFAGRSVNARSPGCNGGLPPRARPGRTARYWMTTTPSAMRSRGRDADIVLDPEAMRQGGVFKVERDFELNRQQYDRLVDAREGIKRAGGIYNAFMGQEGQAASGVAISGLVEQSNQTLADINDNFKESRQNVGDLLMSMIIEDMSGKQETVFIDGKVLNDDRIVNLNVPVVDEATGIQYLDNDISRTKLKVTLADVSSTPSFRCATTGGDE